MFGQLPPNLTTSTERKAKINKEIEPHVDIYDIDTTDKRRVTLPIEILSYSLVVFLVIGLGISQVYGENPFSQIMVAAIAIITPFYLPYIYFFLGYLKKDEKTEIEVDRKHGFIKYTNPITKRNILFHQSQVENCIIYQSLLLPLNLNYVTLFLEGGEQVSFSNLVIDLKEFVQDSTLPYEIKGKYVNLIPMKK